jgi:hypothetical protein
MHAKQYELSKMASIRDQFVTSHQSHLWPRNDTSLCRPVWLWLIATSAVEAHYSVTASRDCKRILVTAVFSITNYVTSYGIDRNC